MHDFLIIIGPNRVLQHDNKSPSTFIALRSKGEAF